MTEAKAHQFVERWERLAFPQRWRAKTEAQAAHRLEQMFSGLMIGAIAVMLTSAGEWGTEVVAFVVLIFCFWQALRSRKARRVLGYS